TTVRQGPSGFERIIQMLLVQQSGLVKQPALFESVCRGNKIPKQLGVNVGSATMTPQLHFTIGHLTIASAQYFLQIERHIPEVSRPMAKPSGMEIERPRSQHKTRRGNSTMSEIVHGDRVSQTLLRIAVQQMQ